MLVQERQAARAADVSGRFEAPSTNGAVALGDSAHAGWCLSCQAKVDVPEGGFKVCSDFTR